LLQWERFAASRLDHFVAAQQALPDAPARTTFPRNVTDLIQEGFGGNGSALARALRVHRRTASDWAAGRQQPSLASLVALAYCFGGEVMDWIAGRPWPAYAHHPRPIARTVAASLRRPLQRYPVGIVRAHLLAATRAAEHPTPSFTAACKRLGVDPAVAKRLCPNLAAGMMSRFRRCQAEGKRARLNSLKRAVESAVARLRAQGQTLSYRQLRKILPPGISARDRLVREEFERLRGASAIA
jgi:hypothetical protein